MSLYCSPISQSRIIVLASLLYVAASKKMLCKGCLTQYLMYIEELRTELLLSSLALSCWLSLAHPTSYCNMPSPWSFISGGVDTEVYSWIRCCGRSQEVFPCYQAERCFKMPISGLPLFRCCVPLADRQIQITSKLFLCCQTVRSI